MPLTRADFQGLAELRRAEAEHLFAAGHFAGAYYLVGYAVECALKACIAKQTRRFDFPDRRFVNDSYTHDLSRLLDLSGLKQKLERTGRRRQLLINWNLVTDWSEESRYDRNVTAAMARDLVSAVTDPTDGVLTWLKKYW